jgi:hypothetical protein
MPAFPGGYVATDSVGIKAFPLSHISTTPYASF